MIRWPALATEGTATFSIDWTKRLPAGSSVSSVAYAFDPTTGLTEGTNSVSSNVSSIDITANTTEREYWVKATPTLSSGNISPVSIRLKVIKHKPAR